MIWPWVLGIAGGSAIAILAPSMKDKTAAKRVLIGVATGIGLAFVINAILELLSLS